MATQNETPISDEQALSAPVAPPATSTQTGTGGEPPVVKFPTPVPPPEAYAKTGQATAPASAQIKMGNVPESGTNDLAVVQLANGEKRIGQRSNLPDFLKSNPGAKEKEIRPGEVAVRLSSGEVKVGSQENLNAFVQANPDAKVMVHGGIVAAFPAPRRYPDIVAPGGGPGAVGEAESQNEPSDLAQIGIGVGKEALKIVGGTIASSEPVESLTSLASTVPAVRNRMQKIEDALAPKNTAQQVGATTTAAGTTAASLGLAAPDLMEGAVSLLRKGGALLRENAIQPGLKAGIRNLFSEVAEENGVAAPKSASIRDNVEEVSQGIMNKSKSQFKKLDEATDGNFQRFDTQIRNLEDKVSQLVGIDDAQAEQLEIKKQYVEARMEEVFAEAKDKGVDPKLVEEAKANWKKAHALKDVSSDLRASTSGMRPNMKGSEANPESVNPDQLFNRLNKRYNVGRLQEGMGDEKAQQMLEHTNDGVVQRQRILNRQKWLKRGGVAVGVGAGEEMIRRATAPARKKISALSAPTLVYNASLGKVETVQPPSKAPSVESPSVVAYNPTTERAEPVEQGA